MGLEGKPAAVEAGTLSALVNIFISLYSGVREATLFSFGGKFAYQDIQNE